MTGADSWVALRYEGVIGNGFSDSESAINSTGKRTVLDTAPTASIPTSSLKLVGSTVRWSAGGAEQSATL